MYDLVGIPSSPYLKEINPLCGREVKISSFSLKFIFPVQEVQTVTPIEGIGGICQKYSEGFIAFEAKVRVITWFRLGWRTGKSLPG